MSNKVVLQPLLSLSRQGLSGSLSRVNASAPRHVHGIQQKEIEGVTLVGKSFGSSRLFNESSVL